MRSLIWKNRRSHLGLLEQWLANLLFYRKLYYGQQFQITEEPF
ncbi:MAG: hypothetical protein VKN72_26515 [Nostocales cyanobacterium 94392]|nr:hypothetical protein [Nostocales cyanobacterium 94392]